MLSFIAQSASMPSLIFLDINMPRLNGKECLQWLKADARFSSIPIIICSTSKNPNDMQECAALGAHYYFTKPMRLKDWEAEVAFILQNFLYVENAKAG
jgi:CheY-like chemotaxis protein